MCCKDESCISFRPPAEPPVGKAKERDALRPGENATPDLKAQHCGLDCANGTMF